MSETPTDTQSTNTSEERTDADERAERSLRERIAENPRPALFWLAGAVILLALEFGRFVAGILAIGSAVHFAVSGLVSGPGWIGDNVGDSLGGWIGGETVIELTGAIAADVTALLMLFVVAVLLHGYLPWGLDDLFDTDLGRRARLHTERIVLTLVLGLLAGIMAWTPIGTFVVAEIQFAVSQLQSLASIPTLTSRETIPNLGHQTPDGGWEGTFLGLSPKWAWFVRFALVWIYVLVALVWLWKGYNVYRDHYRRADWTPRDDTIRRFRNHYWGLFGLAIVIGFLVLAAFAPAISPAPVEHNVYEPYNHEFEYLNENGEVTSVTHGTANLASQSDNVERVGIWSYDDYDRFAPLGTTRNGQDMLTNLAYGARTSLTIALSAVSIGFIVAVSLSLLTAYYKGLLDIVVVLASDTIISIPVLLLAMMLVVLFGDGGHWLAEPLDGGLLLALILGFAYWPGMWRAIRGPSLQVAEEEWVDAAKCYGQTPGKIMRKHMAPYILSYIIIYASLLLGGIIIVVSALSFLGLGITSPTPEWGRLIDNGQPFISSQSWHLATIPGIMITLVVLGFNAVGDGIRDAIDPEADIGSGGGGGAGGGG